MNLSQKTVKRRVRQRRKRLQQKKSGKKQWREWPNQKVMMRKTKIRRSTADAIDYLREKSSNEREYRKEVLEISKREIQLQAEKQNQTQRQQQAMFQQ